MLWGAARCLESFHVTVHAEFRIYLLNGIGREFAAAGAVSAAQNHLTLGERPWISNC